MPPSMDRCFALSQRQKKSIGSDPLHALDQSLDKWPFLRVHKLACKPGVTYKADRSYSEAPGGLEDWKWSLHRTEDTQEASQHVYP